MTETNTLENLTLSPEIAARGVEMAAALQQIGIVREAVQAGRLQPFMKNDYDNYTHTDVSRPFSFGAYHFTIVEGAEPATGFWLGFTEGRQAYELEAESDEPVLHVGPWMQYSDHRGLHNPDYAYRFNNWTHRSYSPEEVTSSGMLLPRFARASQMAFRFAIKHL